MILSVIYSLKYIGAEHLLENKCQPYTEGVQSAWSEYNSIVMLVGTVPKLNPIFGTYLNYDIHHVVQPKRSHHA